MMMRRERGSRKAKKSLLSRLQELKSSQKTVLKRDEDVKDCLICVRMLRPPRLFFFKLAIRAQKKSSWKGDEIE